MIETARLTLIPLTLEQLYLHITDKHQLEKKLGLKKDIGSYLSRY